MTSFTNRVDLLCVIGWAASALVWFHAENTLLGVLNCLVALGYTLKVWDKLSILDRATNVEVTQEQKNG